MEAPFSFADRPIRAINPNVSNELDSIITKALCYKPEDRFQLVTEMKMALIALAQKTGALSKVSSGKLAVQEQIVKPVWTFKCEDEIRGSATVEASNVYIGAYDNNLYAIDASKGQFRWKHAVDGGVISKPLIREWSALLWKRRWQNIRYSGIDRKN